MAQQNEKKKGGTKKHGRSARSPAQARYNGEQRWKKNKRRRIERHLNCIMRKQGAARRRGDVPIVDDKKAEEALARCS